MSKRLELTGQRFGNLVVESLYDIQNRCTRWLCKCDCGNETVVVGARLKRNDIKSCGCLRDKMTSERSKKYNTYDLSGEYGIGYTSKGEEFYFDLEDYNKIKDYCWYIRGDGYVMTNIYSENRTIGFHQIIICDAKGILLVDHRNHKKYDNRKSNLRTTTPSQSVMNRGLSSNNTSGATGVGWVKSKQKWRARINVSKKEISLGLFSNFEDAVKARKKAENKYFGEFSYDNSMKVGDDDVYIS